VTTAFIVVQWIVKQVVIDRDAEHSVAQLSLGDEDGVLKVHQVLIGHFVICKFAISERTDRAWTVAVIGELEPPILESLPKGMK
jgi:hypothetical protein